MTDTSAATLYNPHEQSKQQLIDGFVVHTKLFQRLFRHIEEQDPTYPAQHYLIEGQRGMGKTTLLLRLSYEVENDPELDGLIPLVFKEEAYYGITRLEHLWEKSAELLEIKNAAFTGLLQTLQDGYAEHRNYEEDCFQALFSALERENKHLILFIDNLGELFRQFSDHEAQRLREVLLTCPRLRLIGASAVVLEAFFRYEHAFYEFFKKASLKGLNKEETHDLLKSLAQDQGQAEAISEILQQHPGRVETLRILTGGVLRSIVLLFEIFLDNRNGNAISDLERVLDRVTPLYKHRMDELTPSQREVVNAVALNWDAIAPVELAQQLRLPEAQIRDTLAALEKVYILQRAPTDTQTELFYLYERFFNIWYLMRLAPRGSRGKVLWLVRFLEAWYDREQLAQRAQRQIEALQTGEYHPKAARYMAEAMAYTGYLDEDTEHELLQSTKAFLREKDESLLAGLPESDKILVEKTLSLIEGQNYRQAIDTLLKIKQTNEGVHIVLGECFKQLKDFSKAEQYYLMAVEKDHASAMNNLAVLYEEYHQDYAKAKQYYLMAVEKDDTNAMLNLALLYQYQHQDYAKAEQYYLMAVQKDHADAMYNLALLYEEYHQDYAKAEQYYLMAVEKDDADAMYNLALLYKEHHQDYAKAEQYYLMAVEKDHDRAMNNLANVYKNKHQDYAKAEQYYLMAVEKGDAKAMYNLALLYEEHHQDYAKAERYYLMAVEKDHTNAMCNLALLYQYQHQNYVKAEQYYLMAVEHGENKYAYNNLGYLYQHYLKQVQNYLKQVQKAEYYYLQAIEKGVESQQKKARKNLISLYLEQKAYNKLQQFCDTSVAKGDYPAYNSLAWGYFEAKINKQAALQAIRQCVKKFEQTEIYSMHTLACVEAWNDNFPQATEAAKEFIHDEQAYEEFSEDIARYLMLLIAKHQYTQVAEYFKDGDAEALRTSVTQSVTDSIPTQSVGTRDLKERFKPLYYAFLTLTQHSDAAKQPPELVEPVQEVLAEVEQMAHDYR